jgi:hypothetical protein
LRQVAEDETQSKPVHARYMGFDRLGTPAFVALLFTNFWMVLFSAGENSQYRVTGSDALIVG